MAKRNEATRLPGPERRKQILDLARTEFLRCGLVRTRTRQIAESAGINEGTLYPTYFESKEALFEAAVLNPIRELVQELCGIAEAFGSRDPGRPGSKAHTARSFTSCRR